MMLLNRNLFGRAIVAFALTAAAVFMAPSTLPAADSTWNVNAAGNWDTASNWTAGVPGDVVSLNNPDTATFGPVITAAQIVTVDANRNIFGIDFAGNSFDYTLSGGNLLLTNGGIIQTSLAGSGHTDIISSPIAIQGNGGAVSFTAASTTATRLLSITGAVSGVATVGNTTTLTLNGANTGGNSVNGIISNGLAGGQVALVKDGAGSWTLGGVNTYTGKTTINAGILNIAGSIAGDTRLGAAPAAFVADQLTLNGGRLRVITAGFAFNVNRGWFVQSDSTLEIAAGTNNTAVNTIISGPGALAINVTFGTGVYNPQGQNTYAGGSVLTAVAGGAVVPTSSTVGPAGAPTSGPFGTGILNFAGANFRGTTSGNVTLANNYIFSANTIFLDQTSGRSLFLTGGGTLTGATRTITVNATTVELRGVVTDGGSGFGITKAGTGTLALLATNTFSGPITLTGGVLTFNTLAAGGSPSSLGQSSNAAGNLLLDTGTTLRSVGVGGSTDRAFTLNGIANGFTATIESSGTGAVNFTNTATPLFGTVDQTRTLVLGGTNAGANTLAAALTNNGTGVLSLTKSGLGRWILGTTNTYSGPTTINAGALQFPTTTSASTTSAVTVNSTGVLAVNVGGPGEFTNAMSGAGSVGSIFAGIFGAAVTFASGSGVGLDTTNAAGGTFTYAFDIADIGGASIGVTKFGSGALVLSGNNTNTGANGLAAGRLVVGSPTALSTVTLAITSGATLELAADSAVNPTNSTITGTLPTTLILNRATAGSAVDQILGTLSLSSAPLIVQPGSNVTSGTSRLTFGATTLANPVTFDIAANTVLTLGSLSGSGTLVKNGAGQLTLPFAVTARATSNLTMNAGTLRLENSLSLTTGGNQPATFNGGVISLANNVGTTFLGLTMAIAGTDTKTVESDRLTPGAGVTHIAGTLTIGTSTLNVVAGPNVTSGIAGFQPGNLIFTGSPTFNVAAGAFLNNNGTTTNGANTPILTGAGNVTFNGNYGNGSGGLVLDTTFTGVARLNGTNTFTGSVVLNSGTLLLGNNAVLGATAAVLQINGGSIDVTAIRTLSNNNPIIINNNFTFIGSNTLNFGTGAVNLGTAAGTTRTITTLASISNFPNVISDGTTATGITKAGAGQLFLSAANLYTGPVRITGGILSIPLLTDGGIAGGLGTSSANPANLVLAGGTLRYSGATATSSDRGITLENDSSSGIEVANAINLTLSGPIIGGGSVSKIGGSTTGTLTLSGASTYTGTTTLATGLLAVGSNTGLGTAAGGTTVTLNTSAIILLNGVTVTGESLTLTSGGLGLNGSIGNLVADTNATATWTGPINLGGGNSRIGARDGGVLTLSGPLTNGTILTIAGDLVAFPSGVTVLANANNSYTGATNIVRGTLRLGVDNAIPAGSTLDVHSGPTTNGAGFDFAGFSTVVGALRRGDSSGPSTVSNSALTPSTLTINGLASETFGGIISGSGGVINIIKNGSSTQIFSGANTHTGTTTVNGGILQAGSTTAFGNASVVSLADVAGAELSLSNNSITIGSLAGGGSTGGNVTLGSGRLTVGSANTDTTFAGNVSGTGGVTKTGTGVLSLTAVNSYTGTTLVNGGTLSINGVSSTGAITVNGGATPGTLRGTGALGGLTTVTTGGTVRAGNSGAGTLTLNGGLTVNASGIIFVALADASTTGTVNSGSSTDLINLPNPLNNNYLNITGVATINNGALITVDGTGLSFSAASSYSYQVGRASNNLSALAITSLSQFNFINVPVDPAASISLNGTSTGEIYLNFTTPVPEPMLLLGVAALTVFAARRRLRTL